MKLLTTAHVASIGASILLALSSTSIAQTGQLNFKVSSLSDKVLNGPVTIEKQGSFFVGGKDIESSTLSTLPAYAQSGTITVDQMYVRYQAPVKAKNTSMFENVLNK